MTQYPITQCQYRSNPSYNNPSLRVYARLHHL